MNKDEAYAFNAAIRTIGMRHRAMAGAALNRIGLSVGQEVLIMELFQHGPKTQTELADAAGCEPPTITSAVKRLEAQGIVSRRTSTTDKRATVVDLTAHGESLLEDLAIEWKGLANESVAGLSRTNVDDLIEGLTDLAASLKSVTQRKTSGPNPVTHSN